MVIKPTLVGESNPYGGDDYYALYPAPDGCAGHRLCCLILGMSRRAYLESFERVNLLRGRWSAPKAREAARGLRGRRLILLGVKVAAAFGMDFTPFASALEERDCQRTEMLVLPHPSGRNRLWLDLDYIGKARAAVADFCPELATIIGPR